MKTNSKKINIYADNEYVCSSTIFQSLKEAKQKIEAQSLRGDVFVAGRGIVKIKGKTIIVEYAKE